MQPPVAAVVEHAAEQAQGKYLAGVGVAGELQVDAEPLVQGAGCVRYPVCCDTSPSPRCRMSVGV